MRLRDRLIRRLPGSQRQALGWSLLVLAVSVLLTWAGLAVGSEVNTFGCEPPPGDDPQCRTLATYHVLGTFAVGLGPVVAVATLFLMPSLFGQLRQAARDRALYAPRLQGLKDWYALARIRRTTLDGLAPALEDLVRDREPTTSAWAVSRTWTAVAVGATFGLLLGAAGVAVVADVGTTYCEDTPNPGCPVYRAGTGAAIVTLIVVASLVVAMHLTGWPFRAEASRRRRRLVARLDELEAAALEEANRAGGLQETTKEPK